MFGDSYLSLTGNAYWPYYIKEKGYDNCMYSGFSGAPSETMYRDWKSALSHGTPKYAVWCLGMNNKDIDTTVNASWLGCVKAFINDCEENGIIPILTTVPNVPERIHTFKNDYIKSSGYRYIDFASAVGATTIGSSWLEGHLHTDNVHPATKGAKALAEQVIIDFPEIKDGKN